jgi:hypothetical protein
MRESRWSRAKTFVETGGNGENREKKMKRIAAAWIQVVGVGKVRNLTKAIPMD